MNNIQDFEYNQFKDDIDNIIERTVYNNSVSSTTSPYGKVIITSYDDFINLVKYTKLLEKKLKEHNIIISE